MSPPGPESPRNPPRQRTLKGARIVFNNGRSSIDVLIRDMSESGAKLKLGTAGWAAPDAFDLVVLNTNSGVSTTYHCEKRWQRGDLVGARFVDPPPRRTPAIPAAVHVRHTLTRN